MSRLPYGRSDSGRFLPPPTILQSAALIPQQLLTACKGWTGLLNLPGGPREVQGSSIVDFAEANPWQSHTKY